MNKDVVSIVVPTYNRRNFLPINLKSLLSQTYKNIEILVVNDHGEDVSDIINGFNDNRIKYIVNEKNLGLAGSRNVGINHSKGKWICTIDDDDGATEIFIENMLRIVKEQNCQVAYCDSVRLHQKKDSNGDFQIIWRDIPYSHDFNRDLLLVMNISPVNCFIINRECFNNVPPYDETVKIYEDYLMNLELSLKYDFYHYPIPLVWHTWREDTTSMSSSRDFTTPIPGIYSKYFQYAENKVWVAQAMNSVLRSRGLPEMFKFENHP